MSRRAKIASRATLIVASIAALALSALWLVVAGLAAGSHESACQGEGAVDLAFAGAYVGAVLAIIGLIAGIVNSLKLGWSALVVYAGLFVAALFAVSTCGG